MILPISSVTGSDFWIPTYISVLAISLSSIFPFSFAFSEVSPPMVLSPPYISSPSEISPCSSIYSYAFLSNSSYSSSISSSFGVFGELSGNSLSSILLKSFPATSTIIWLVPHDIRVRISAMQMPYFQFHFIRYPMMKEMAAIHMIGTTSTNAVNNCKFLTQ